ncbi:MAG: hypothetical protein WA896_04455, partial [Spirulinaceae cyanobacterium]
MVNQKAEVPQAKKHPEELVNHGDKRIDNYFWLRHAQQAETIAYLEAENAYTEKVMAHTVELQQTLYKEMLGRIKETDLSVPYREGAYFYYSRTEEGKPYSIECRKQGNLDAPEEIILDQNQLAEGKEFCELGVVSVSPNHQLLAYSVDYSGAERYILYFLDLTTKKVYSESIQDTYYSFAWGNDNRTVFYTKVDSTNRPYQL